MSRAQHLAYVTNVRVSSLPSARRLLLPEHSGTVLWCDMSVCWKGDEVHALRHYIKWWQSASAVLAAGDNIPGTSAPLQRPYPKLLIAANLDSGIRRAARLADGWLVSSRATFTTVQRQMAIYRDALQQTGRTGYVAAWREMFVAQSRAAAITTILFAPMWRGSTATGRRWAITACCQQQTALMCHLSRC